MHQRLSDLETGLSEATQAPCGSVLLHPAITSDMCEPLDDILSADRKEPLILIKMAKDNDANTLHVPTKHLAIKVPQLPLEHSLALEAA